MRSTVDVLLPYYGDVDLFKRAVESVVGQTHQDWRLVVIDDGYPDPEPAAWMRALAARDTRISYLRNETNLGANGNYQKALTMATAPMFVMMGADDIMLPNYLATISNQVLAHPEVDVIQPGVQVIDGEGRVYVPLVDRVKSWYAPHVDGSLLLQGEAMAASLVRADWAYFPSLAWKTSTVQRIGFRSGLDVVQDLALLLDIASEGGSMLVLKELSFQYRRHAASDSSVRAFDGRRFDEERRFFADEASRFAAMGWATASRAAKRRWSSRLHVMSLMAKATGRGRLRAAIKLAPYALGR